MRCAGTHRGLGAHISKVRVGSASGVRVQELHLTAEGLACRGPGSGFAGLILQLQGGSGSCLLPGV